MFAARPFASLAFAEKATYLVEGGGAWQGVAVCTGRGQTIRDGAASTLSAGAMLARSNPWNNADLWAQAYANAGFNADVILDVEMLASGQTVTSLQAGYTLPTRFSATAGSGFAAHGIQVVHSVLAAAGLASMQVSGYPTRQASARADGVAGMRAVGARKIGSGMDARGIAGFTIYSAMTGPYEAILDANGVARAVFHIDALQDAVMIWSDSSAFYAAGQAFGQAMLKAQAAATADMHGTSYASMYAIMAGAARTNFIGWRAGFNMGDMLASGDSWANIHTATARNGGAYMAGQAEADFQTEYAQAIMASLFAAGAAHAQLDGFRRIFVMADAVADAHTTASIDANAYASSTLDAVAAASTDVHGIAVHNTITLMQGIGRLKWNVGKPIFQFLPPAYNTVIRQHEVRGIERPYEPRKVERP